jgi:hypothetical protein
MCGSKKEGEIPLKAYRVPLNCCSSFAKNTVATTSQAAKNNLFILRFANENSIHFEV